MTDVHEVAPGKVPAEASLWRLYFPLGETPKESAVRRALGATRAVKTTQMTSPSVISHDESVDPDMVTVHEFEAPQPTFDPEVLEESLEENIETSFHSSEIPSIVELSEHEATDTIKESE